MEETPSPPVWKKRLLWLVWVGYLLLLSRGLLMEQPIDPGGNKQLEMSLFFFSKTVHVVSYAFWAVLSGWLDVPRPYRWLLLVLMSAHAMGTEYGQQFFRTRHPSWRDVGLDHIGLAIGLALSWKWWRKA